MLTSVKIVSLDIFARILGRLLRISIIFILNPQNALSDPFSGTWENPEDDPASKFYKAKMK
jgi:hypothetical protein